jgi:toxin ParE1/3/4
MSALQVVFHRLAAREYRSARDWYAERSAEVSQRFRLAVDVAVKRIAAQYEALPVLSGPYRRIRVNRFPYILICRVLAEGPVMVVAVAHTSRRPGDWRRRS